MSTKNEPDQEPYDPEKSLEADEKIGLANLKSGAYKTEKRGADGVYREVDFNDS